MRTTWYVLYRDPESALVEHWKVMGSAPCQGFANEEDANHAADRLAKEFDYVVQVVKRTKLIQVEGEWFDE